MSFATPLAWGFSSSIFRDEDEIVSVVCVMNFFFKASTYIIQ